MTTGDGQATGAGGSEFAPGPAAAIAAPLQLHTAAVVPEWVDYNNHLSEWAYLLIFGDNADALFRFIGIDEAYRASGKSLYTAETHLRHLREVKLGQRLTLTLTVLGHDDKRLHLLHEMLTDSAGCVAAAEQMLLHVDAVVGRVAPFGPDVADRLRLIAASHSALPWPEYVGTCLRIPER
jgi:acyl-CoA thioester hydrolase